jgi:hypothetical protein
MSKIEVPAGRARRSSFVAQRQPDTLYFNAFTEDLFSWDNDLEKDSERRLHINTDSQFFKGLRELALDERIGHYLARYADFLFDMDYDQWAVSFRKDEARHIKVSRVEDTSSSGAYSWPSASG